jgi:hypothetical protein
MNQERVIQYSILFCSIQHTISDTIRNRSEGTARMSEASMGDKLISYSKHNNISEVESLLSRSNKSSFINYQDNEVINKSRICYLTCDTYVVLYTIGWICCSSLCCIVWSFRNSDTVDQ